ncbi:acyl-CoA dehydrogenase, putative phosphotransferase [Olavius sp. associated proteobacterium Delta 1]|nr:acyl-CoA dehydrogenase, putative phosphotransferase [Olavius sp. associated proteobacterium Delta 1]
MKTDAKLTPVREAHRFDENALDDYLKNNLAGYAGSLKVQQFEGGQSNPTFLLNAGGQEYVMRKKPPGKLLPSAHAVEREYRVMKALEQSDVPVPRMYLLCEDENIIGTPFFVMEHVQSRVLEDITLPGMTPAERHAIYFDLIRVLAALHSIDFADLGLDNFGKPGNYFSRQIGRWSKQYMAAKTDEIESMERLMEYLPANVPADETSCIVHGDYRMGNILLHPTEPKMVALVDWELSTLGHPLGDLGYSCMFYHSEIAGRISLDGLTGSATGIPSEEEFLAEYCRLSGRDGIPNWNFYLAFSFFRLASILQGVYKRGIMGNASSTEAMERGRMAREISDLAWRLIK